MKSVITWLLVIILLVLHQDYWQWERNEIVFGFVPYTLAYNIGISIVTAGLWIAVCSFLWPDHLDECLDEARLTDASHEQGGGQ